MTDTPRITVRRVEPLGSGHQPVQLVPERAQLSDPAVELCGAGPQEVEHVAAGRLPLVSKSHDAADLTQ